EEIAVRDRNQSLTWHDVDARLRTLATALQNSNLGPDRRVAILARNSADTLLGYVACTLAGASAVAVNSHLTAPETAYILADSRAGLV
ncbi:AMP-binding protein, partial [Mycobacterium kansasii]